MDGARHAECGHSLLNWQVDLEILTECFAGLNCDATGHLTSGIEIGMSDGYVIMAGGQANGVMPLGIGPTGEPLVAA